MSQPTPGAAAALVDVGWSCASPLRGYAPAQPTSTAKEEHPDDNDIATTSTTIEATIRNGNFGCRRWER